MTPGPNDEAQAASEFASVAMGRAVAAAKADLRACGFKPTRVLMVIEIELEGDEPIRTAGAWPEGDTAGALDLAQEGVTAFRMMHVSSQTKGQG